MIKKSGFTLAEGLTTLMLIGVVAALTLPFFISEIQKSRWTVTYKRTFAETFNVLTRVAMDEDCSKSLTCTHLFDGGQTSSTKAFGDAMTKIMSVQKNCGNSGDATNCFSHDIKIGFDTQNAPETIEQTMLGDAVALAEGNHFYTFMTTRGVSYAVLSFGLNCLNDSADEASKDQYINAYVLDPEHDTTNQMLSLCGFIIVDVNADQKPNTWGRDVFGIWITDRSVLGVYPFGGDYDKKFHDGCNGDDSRGCAAQLIKDGWTMKY